MEQTMHPIAAIVLQREQLANMAEAWRHAANRVMERSTLPEHTSYADAMNTCASAIEYLLKNESR